MMLKRILIICLCGMILHCSDEEPISCTADYIQRPFKKKEKYTTTKNTSLSSCFFETKEAQERKNLETILSTAARGGGSSSTSSPTPTLTQYVYIAQSITSFTCSDNSSYSGIPSDYGQANYRAGTCASLGFDSTMETRLYGYSRFTCKFTNSTSVNQTVCTQTILNNLLNRNFTWKDSISPTIVNVYPASGSANVSIYQTIIITYDENLDPDAFIPANIKLFNGTLPVSIIIKGNGKYIHILPDPITSTWTNATTYTVSLENIKDYQENRAVNYSYSFTTE